MDNVILTLKEMLPTYNYIRSGYIADGKENDAFYVQGRIDMINKVIKMAEDEEFCDMMLFANRVFAGAIDQAK